MWSLVLNDYFDVAVIVRRLHETCANKKFPSKEKGKEGEMLLSLCYVSIEFMIYDVSLEAKGSNWLLF